MPRTTATAAGPEARRRPAAYQTLEAWRGVAALWVVLYHGVLMSAPAPGPWLLESPDTAFMARGQLGVPIFFVISGYCIAAAANSARSKGRPVAAFLKARVRRIYPPYYASTAFYMLALAAQSALGDASPVPGRGLRAEFLDRGPLFHLATLTLTQLPLRQLPYSVVLWSLCYEVAFYAIVAAALAATLRLGAGATLGLLHATTLATLAWLDLSPGTCPFPLDLWPQFGFGVMVYHVTTSPRPAAPAALLATASALAVARVLRPGEMPFPNVPPAYALGFSLAFALALVALRPFDAATERLRPVRWLAWVGTFSYSLYLTHTVILTVVGKVTRRLAGDPSHFRIQVALGAVAAVIFARAFFIVGERPFLSARAPKPDRPEVAVAEPAAGAPEPAAPPA